MFIPLSYLHTNEATLSFHSLETTNTKITTEIFSVLFWDDKTPLMPLIQTMNQMLYGHLKVSVFKICGCEV